MKLAKGVHAKWCVNGILVSGLLVRPIIGFCTGKEIQKHGGCVQRNWEWSV